MIKDDDKYHIEELPVIRPKDVDYWFERSHLTLDPSIATKASAIDS
jgi:hypothetical protein